MIAIILNHLHFYPNGLEWVEMRGDLFASAAEGFFFISGIVLGMVRGQKLIREPFQKVAKLLLGRAGKLYLTSIILTILFTLIGWIFLQSPGLKSGILPPSANFFETIWKTVTFQYHYGWADYLYMYSLFLLASPIVMWLLRKGWWYVALAGSIILWLCFPPTAGLSDATRDAWQPLAWQLLFFGGMIVGFNWKNIAAWWRKRSTGLRKIIFAGVVSLATITLFANVIVVLFTFDIGGHMHDIIAPLQSEWYANFFVKESLPLPRILLFLLWFTAGFMVVRKSESWIVRKFGWLILPFGTNSLYSYIVGAFVLFFAHLFLNPGGVLFNLAISIGCVALVWVAIHYKFLMRIIPR